MILLRSGAGWVGFTRRLVDRLGKNHDIRFIDPDRPLAEQVAETEILLPSGAPVTAEGIEAARNLKLIQRPGVGYEGVDVAAAARRGIPVCNAPATNPIAVAECALLLMLALARRWNEAQSNLRAGVTGTPDGIELAGRTLGIVGPGDSGAALAVRARALGMEVIAIRKDPSKGAPDGVRLLGGLEALPALLETSDFVSLHCPLTPETEGLIGADALSRMKPGAYLINLARGGVVDRDALHTALDAGRIAGAGLDVFWEEPPHPDDPVVAHPRVVATPHVAGSTEEAIDRTLAIVEENLRRIASGEPPLHRVG